MPDEWISVTEAIGRLAQAKRIKPEKVIPELLTLVATKRLDTRIAKVVSALRSEPLRNVPMTEDHWDLIINLLPGSFGKSGEVFFDDEDDTYWLGIEVHAGDFEREIGHLGPGDHASWVDASEREGSYVPLPEALSWIAFGKPMNIDQLERLLSSKEGPAAARELGAAMRKLSKCARKGQIRLKGSYAAIYSEPSANDLVSSDFLSATQLQEFSCFEHTHGGLIRGDGGETEGDASEGRSAGWRNVVVCHDELLDAFPAGVGSIPNNLPRLPDARLAEWWENLPDTHKAKPQDELYKLCNAAHPKNSVSRQRVRDLTPGRKPGPKPNRP